MTQGVTSDVDEHAPNRGNDQTGAHDKDDAPDGGPIFVSRDSESFDIFPYGEYYPSNANGSEEGKREDTQSSDESTLSNLSPILRGNTLGMVDGDLHQTPGSYASLRFDTPEGEANAPDVVGSEISGLSKYRDPKTQDNNMTAMTRGAALVCVVSVVTFFVCKQQNKQSRRGNRFKP